MAGTEAGRGPDWRLLSLAACLFLAAAGAALGEAGLFAPALPLAAWLVLGSGRRAPALDLSAERKLEAGLARPGQAMAMECVVRNNGGRIDCLCLEDCLPEGVALLSGRHSWRGSLGPGECATMAYAFSAGRGGYAFGAIKALAIDPFSSREARLELSAPALAVVEAGAGREESLALAARAVKAFSGMSRIKRQGGGSEFAGTRDYSPGDPLRSLNWRAEARYGHSVVNLFEEERALDVGIILDARAEAYTDEALFEASLSRALGLGLGLLEGGNRVGFLSYGFVVAWTSPGLGREQKLKLRRAAARAVLGDHAVFERFDNLPIGLFPPESSILLVSPLLPADLLPLGSLAARGYKVTVCRMSSRERGGEDLARRILGLEAGLLKARLEAMGIEVLDVGVEG